MGKRRTDDGQGVPPKLRRSWEISGADEGHTFSDIDRSRYMHIRANRWGHATTAHPGSLGAADVRDEVVQVMDAAGLTAREKEILRRQHAGETRSAIAEAMGLSFHQVHRAVKTAHAKLDEYAEAVRQLGAKRGDPT
jgi:DNA-binding NarL/FixJ family response regulator